MAKNSNTLKIIKEYINDLKNKIKIEKVILFGSAARNQMTYHSDIDLIIISSDFKNIDFIKRLQILSHARKGSARKVPMDILGYTNEEYIKLVQNSVVIGEADRQGKKIKA